MKNGKQIVFALFLGAMFIAWLFYNTSANQNLAIARLKNESESKRKELEYKYKELEYKYYEENNKPHYELGNLKSGDMSVPLVFNKKTGQSWRGFTDNESRLSGFIPLIYETSGEALGLTPAIPKDNVKRFSELYNKEIGALTDKDKKDGYKFIDENEAKEFDIAVRNAVAANSAGVNSDEDFVNLIRGTAKVAYDNMSKRRKEPSTRISPEMWEEIEKLSK